MYKHTHSTFPQKKVSPYKVQPFKHGGTLALEMAFWSLGAPSKNYYNYSSDAGKHKKKRNVAYWTPWSVLYSYIIFNNNNDMKQNINNKAVNIVELPYSGHQLEE